MLSSGHKPRHRRRKRGRRRPHGSSESYSTEILRGLVSVPREDSRVHISAGSLVRALPGVKAGAVYRASPGNEFSASGHPQPAARLCRPGAGLVLRRRGASGLSPVAGEPGCPPQPACPALPPVVAHSDRRWLRPAPHARRPSAAGTARRAGDAAPEQGRFVRGSPAAHARHRPHLAPARDPRSPSEPGARPRRRPPRFNSDTAACRIMSALEMRLSSAS